MRGGGGRWGGEGGGREGGRERGGKGEEREGGREGGRGRRKEGGKEGQREVVNSMLVVISLWSMLHTTVVHSELILYYYISP